MSYYDGLWGSDVKIVMQDEKKQTLTKLYGTAKGIGPLYLKHPPQGFPSGYPAYEVITMNGITEIGHSALLAQYLLNCRCVFLL